ncbi:hypothetical protein [Nocardioides sp. Leaf285]|uniref:hypothetical protein n=1 Tax=Nocardioides sp. Leaf285 TaxID=1736322 RepID=UPI000702524D|nr:hypothetical protein [Nocardioides sp. Leaf285]KQP62824.1 hypothetical protein ASF47_17585 [Nocardioides sp. Leaf285]
MSAHTPQPAAGSQARQPEDRDPLAASMRRHPAGKRLAPRRAAAIAARSVCPTCDGREATAGEETYATCIFCATGTTKPVLPEPSLLAEAERRRPLAPVVPLASRHERFGNDDVALALD